MNFSCKTVGPFQFFIFKLHICLFLDEAGDKIFLFGASSFPSWWLPCGFTNCPYAGFSRGACKQFPSLIRRVLKLSRLRHCTCTRWNVSSYSSFRSLLDQVLRSCCHHLAGYTRYGISIILYFRCSHSRRLGCFQNVTINKFPLRTRCTPGKTHLVGARARISRRHSPLMSILKCLGFGMQRFLST